MPAEAASAEERIAAPFMPWLHGVDLSRLSLTRRIAKIGFAITLCSAGVYGMISNSTYITSSDAVISADLVKVRAPIDGTITGLQLSEGSFVRAGQLLGTLNNPRSDRQHLDNLVAAQTSSESIIKALTSERLELQVQSRDLLNRSRLDSLAVASRLGQQATSAAYDGSVGTGQR
jgi:multidrug resistance efflux pump